MTLLIVLLALWRRRRPTAPTPTRDSSTTAVARPRDLGTRNDWALAGGW